MVDNNIDGRVIVITGASSGIGEATAKLLAARGAKVVLGARRADRLDQIVRDITTGGGHAVSKVTDVTVASDNDAIVKLATQTYGRLDAIFLNAGLMPSSPVSALETGEWHRMVDVNINGVLNGVAAALPSFVEQKSGYVIATSSVAGLKAYPNGAVYGGTKWFVREFMEVLRMESAMEGTNIRTATLYPAAVDTELLDTITDRGAAEGMQALYARYGISPQRVAEVVAFALNLPPTPRSASSPSDPRPNRGDVSQPFVGPALPKPSTAAIPFPTGQAPTSSRSKREIPRSRRPGDVGPTGAGWGRSAQRRRSAHSTASPRSGARGDITRRALAGSTLRSFVVSQVRGRSVDIDRTGIGSGPWRKCTFRRTERRRRRDEAAGR